MKRTSLLIVLGIAACNLPPPTTVNVSPANGRGTAEYPAVPAQTTNFEASDLTRDSLKPFCDVRSGKPTNDDKQLAKVIAGVGTWQKLGKKAPPKPPAPTNPNQGPVTVTSTGVGIKIPGLASGKPATDQDPAWFAISCEGGKITATLDDEPMDLDALYVYESRSSPELWLAGYSLKTKGAIMAKLNTTPRGAHVVPNTSFHVYDLSRYVVAKVDDVEVQIGPSGFKMFFLEEGKTAGVRVLGKQYSDSVDVGRFTVGAPPAPAK